MVIMSVPLPVCVIVTKVGGLTRERDGVSPSSGSEALTVTLVDSPVVTLTEWGIMESMTGGLSEGMSMRMKTSVVL